MVCCGSGSNEEDINNGQPISHDPDFKGPLKHRSCTDVLCLLLFLVFLGCWTGIGIYAFRNGDTSAILVPKDSNGLKCGVDSPVKDRPYLFFFDLTKCIGPSVPFVGCPTPQVCVKKCPTENYYKDDPDKTKMICQDHATTIKPDGVNCAEWYLKSTPIQYRCIPDLTAESVKDFIENKLKSTMSIMKKAVENIKLITETEQVGQNIVNDLMESWKMIVIGLVASLFIILIYILMLRWTAGIMVWVSIVGVVVALGFGVYASAMAYRNVLQHEDSTLVNPDTESFHNFRKYFWLTVLIFLSVVLLIILLVTLFLRSRISLAIALIEEASKAISSVTSVFVFPIFPWVLQIGVIVFAILVALLLTTTGKPLYKIKLLNNDTSTECSSHVNEICDPNHFNIPNCPVLACKMIEMQHNVYYDYMHLWNVVGFFWGTFYVSALGQMILASVFATWYWTRPRSKLPFFAVTSSTLTVLRYHLGTIAFGSLIITICRMIRVVLEYLDRKLKKYDNEITRAIMCLLKCFFWCLEKFLRFMNTNAYIMCAIHGRNFCASAKDAFMLLMRNIIRVFVLDKVTDFLFFISSVLISLGVGAIAYLFFGTDLTPVDNSNLNYFEVPIVVLVVCTYFISTIFFSVYSMAVDTLFLCFLEDCERNDGSPDKPYFMSKDLMKIFGKKNKIE